MKNIVFLTLFLVLAINPLVYGHISNQINKDEVLRKWSFINQNEKLSASFLNFNNEMVMLEDANGYIRHFVITDLSLEDRQFVLAKHELFKLSNQPIIDASSGIPVDKSITVPLFGFLVFFLVTISYLVSNKMKQLRIKS